MLNARGCRRPEGSTDDRQAMNIPGEHETLLHKDCRIWVQGRQELPTLTTTQEGSSICGRVGRLQRC